MHVLFVAGRFDLQGGKPSGYAKKLNWALASHFPSMTSANGGSFEKLRHLRAIMAKNCDVILWMADVPNTLPKMVESIKKNYPRKLLVTSKRNLTEDSYSIQDVVTRTLALKSNLVLMVSGTRNNLLGTVLDPLGTAYCHEEGDIEVVAKTLANRIKQLRAFTRVPSRSIGLAQVAPHENEFFELIKTQADKFHEIIHGIGHERMLGNASFRCAKGFPSIRGENGLVFVSQRNVDKRFVEPNAFVATQLAEDGSVEYYGDIKPSVDTPIQLRLYKALPWVNYMLHSHTYVQNAPQTSSPVPCGAIEEADQILKVLKGVPPGTCWAVNIIGHGSLVLARNVSGLRGVEWVPRPVPEHC